MIHTLLAAQLEEVGLSEDTLPTTMEAWHNLLHEIGQAYDHGTQVENRFSRQNELLTAFHKTALEISVQQDLQVLLETIVQRAVELEDAWIGGLYLLLPDQQHLEGRVLYNMPSHLKGVQIRLGDGAIGMSAEKRAPIIIDDYQKWPDRLPVFEDPKYHSVMAVPLMWQNQVIGVIDLADIYVGRFTEEDVEILRLLAHQATVAIIHARLNNLLQSEVMERIEVEESLKRSENQYRLMFDHAPIGVTTVGLDGKYLRVNSAFCNLLGYTSDEIYRIDFSQLTYPDDMEINLSLDNKLIGGEIGSYEMEKRYLQKNGKVIYTILKVTLVRDDNGNPAHFVGYFIDITERKQTQATLEGSRQTYQNLFDAAQRRARELMLLGQVRTALARELDLSDLIRAVVEAIANTFGYALVSLYLRYGDKLVLQHQVGYHQTIPEMSISQGVSGRVARSGQAELVKDVRQDPDFLGAIEGIVSEICVPLLDHKQVVGSLNIETTIQGGILTDADLELMKALAEHISIAIERARLYASVREAKEQYQVVVDNVREVIFQTDNLGRFTFLNAAWKTITGFRLEESLSQNSTKFFHPYERQKNVVEDDLFIRGKRGFNRWQMRCLTHTGDLRPVEIHIQLIHDGNGDVAGIIGTLTDISDRLLVEQQASELQLQQRTLEVLKQILTNISHDLRTPLSIMNTSTYLIGRKIGTDAPITSHVDVLNDQIAQLTRIVEELVDVSSLDDELIILQLMEVDLNELVQDVLMGMQNALEAKNHIWKTVLDSEIPPMRADHTMLSKVITSLVQNAINFTPIGGSITVRTENDSNYVLLEVSDTGIGIAEEHWQHIFERFYKVDKSRPTDLGGAGLGLTIAQKIIAAHHGTVDVRSTPNKGSVFTVRLPILQ